jgi:translocation and assembly module TamB
MSAAPTRRRWLAPIATIGLTAIGTGVAIGPGAALLVDTALDGRRVWRLGQIEIDGVSGSWLGALRAERVTIADGDGVWIEARDLELAWRPQDILFGAVNIDHAHARRIDILRQPHLLERRPPGSLSLDVALADTTIGEVNVREEVVGAAGLFRADLSLTIDNKSLSAIDLDLQRTDSDADRALIVYDRRALHELRADVSGAPGGVFAHALGAPSEELRATARGEGDADTGAAALLVRVGADEREETTFVSVLGDWKPDRWAITHGVMRLDRLPALQTLARRIGATIDLRANGARHGAFEASAETPFFAATLNGALDADNTLSGPAQLVVTADRLSDIARESPFDLGAARFQGELAQARGTIAVRGTLSTAIDALGQASTLSGPLEAALTSDAFTLSGDLRAPAQAPPLFDGARLDATMNYDRHSGRYELARATFTSEAGSVDARGAVVRGEGEFSGEWRVRKLGALVASIDGQGEGRWRAFSERIDSTRVWSASVDGRAHSFSDRADLLPQLFGQSLELDARLRSETGGLTVSYVRIEGARLRGGARGRIVRGVADLALEASARGPIDFGDASIDGAVDATGRLTGPLARPTLALDAAMSSFAAGDIVVAQPRVQLTLAPSGASYIGSAEVTGEALGQPLQATSALSLTNGALVLTSVDAQLAALSARGEARLGDAGLDADLAISGRIDGLFGDASGAIAGRAALSPEALRLNADLTNARAGLLSVRAAAITAEGPYNAIVARYDMRGRLREAPLTFAGDARLDLDGDSTLSLDGRGQLAGVDAFTRAPIRAVWRPQNMDASLNVALGDGVVTAEWRERGRALSGSAHIEDAPLAPLAAIWGERATGGIDGDISLANQGGGLAGSADLRLDDARFAGRQRGTLDLHIVGDLDPGRLRARVDAASSDGLVAHFEADAPVSTSAAPLRIALARERGGRATWSLRGPADALWAATRLQDQALAGVITGEGELSFGAGRLSGNGFIEVVDGRFEDKLTGVTLVDLDARLALDQRGVTIERFTAADPRGGRLTATGGSTDPRLGEITVQLSDIRIADRPDARARASGALTLAWEGLHSRLTGELAVAEADLDIAASPQAGIATIDVVEINRPGDEGYESEAAAQPHRNGSTELDVRITGPGRVFTRGRGVDAEWALDLRLAGTATHPRIFGEARAVRGTIALSGQPFEIADTSRIVFNGDPLDARIALTAERATSDLTAYLNINGVAQDPEVTFTSDPGLPEDEILPQVLFGRSVEDLSALEAAQLATSLAALSGNGGLDLVDAARAAAGLDRFNVRQDEDGGFLVSGGVYLTRDVYVELGRSSLGEARSTVEWTVRPRLVLITSFLGNGDQRVSLRWRRESD